MKHLRGDTIPHRLRQEDRTPENSHRDTHRARTIVIAACALLFFAALSFTSHDGQACAQERLSISGTGSVPTMAADGHGGFYVIWQHLEDGIYLKHFTAQGAPVAQDSVAFAGTKASRDPRIAVGARSTIAVWEYESSNYVTFFYSMIRGSISGLTDMHRRSVYELNTNHGDYYCHHPSAVFLGDTVVMTVWDENADGGGERIKGQLVSTSGARIGTEILMTPHPVAAVRESGARLLYKQGSSAFFVVWRSDASGKENLYGRKFDLNGTAMGDAFLISDDPQMTDMYYFGVAMDTEGNFCAVWPAEKGARSQMEWRWYTKEGVAATGIETLTPLDTVITSGNCVDISIDEKNRAAIVWEQVPSPKSGASRIYGRCYSAASRAALGETFRISGERTGGYDSYPAVVAAGGRIFVAWQKDVSGVEGALFDIGNVTSVSQEQDGKTTAREFSLAQNYPNPFNPSTVIAFTMPERARVELTISNILGERVATLVSGELPSGTHTRQWNAAGFPSGVYFCRLQAGAYAETKRLSLVK